MKPKKDKIREIIFDIICSCNEHGSHVNPYKKEIDKWIEELEQDIKEGLICPFCNEIGFDKPGLKYHLANYCKEYEQTKQL